MLTLLLALLLVPAPGAADVTLHVVPYTDNNAWSQAHASQLKKLLTWCRGHDVSLAAFYFEAAHRNAPDVTRVLREFANNGTIAVVGTQTVSHSLGGLPSSIQYWELVRGLQYTRDRLDRSYPILHVPYWVFGETTLKACAKAGIRALISGLGPGVDPEFLRRRYPELARVDAIGRHLLVGRWRVDGTTIYHLPALSFTNDLGGSADLALSRLERGLELLLRSGLVRDGDRLMVWVLLEPWQMGDQTLTEFESFLERLKRGVTLRVNGLTARIELADPGRVVRSLDSYRSIEFPIPSYERALRYEGYAPIGSLQVDPEVRHLYERYLETLRSVDDRLSRLLERGLVDRELERHLDRVVQLAWNDAALYAALRGWGDVNLVKRHLRLLVDAARELARAVNERYLRVVGGRHRTPPVGEGSGADRAEVAKSGTHTGTARAKEAARTAVTRKETGVRARSTLTEGPGRSQVRGARPEVEARKGSKEIRNDGTRTGDRASRAARSGAPLDRAPVSPVVHLPVLTLPLYRRVRIG
ncbi:MAG: hypothetical protein ABGY09_02335 [Euryarchaeota archaeon]